MITLTSNSASPEELKQVLIDKGIVPDDESAVVPSDKPSESDKAPSPGESPSGAPKDKTAPATEEGETPQGKQAAEPAVPAEPKPEGKFEPRRKQLEKQVARLHEDLELERGSKTALQDKIKAMEAELATLKPAEADKPKVDDAPVKPTRPKRADFDFDDDKYEAALDAYDSEVVAYNEALNKRIITQELAARDEKAKVDAQKAEADKVFSSFVQRRDEGAKQIEGYAELRKAAGDYKLPDEVELHMIELSQHPAAFIAYFDRDQVENDGKELARIAALPPRFQIHEMAKLELQLASGAKKNPKPAADPPVPAAAAPVVDEAKPATPEVIPPAKPKLKPEDAPIEPLGGRTAGRNATLADAAGNPKKYFELRAQGVNR